MAVHCRTLALRKGLGQIFDCVGLSGCLSVQLHVHRRISKLVKQNAQSIVTCAPLAPGIHKTQLIATHHRCYGTQSSRSEPISLEAESEEMSETEVIEADAAKRIKSLNLEMEKKLKVIKLEYEVMLHTGETVAENMTNSMWMQLFDCETKSARRRLHVYFRKGEKYKLAKERKRAVRREQHEERRIAFETGEIEKAPLNTFLLKLRKKTVLTYCNSRLANAMLYGSPLLIDLGFEDCMKQREIVNLSEQLMLGHGFNKTHKDPFHLIFCNASQDSGVVKSMQKQAGLLPLDHYMFTLTEKSYRDLYPSNNLVYLTPNAKDVMTKYDYDKVYILGGIVDKANPKPFTMAKAKREGIAMQKLPLDYYHKWEKGTKSLTLDQMIRILLDIQLTQNWFKAFRHLPARKIIQDDPSYGRTF